MLIGIENQLVRKKKLNLVVEKFDSCSTKKSKQITLKKAFNVYKK
jgi:hypothetical protein